LIEPDQPEPDEPVDFATLDIHDEPHQRVTRRCIARSGADSGTGGSSS
jgi:hypothetical protein